MTLRELKRHPVVEIVRLARLKANQRNARTHSKRQIAQIARAILQWGWTAPILVDENYCIIAGHGRALAAESLGLKQVPVIVITGLSETEKRALAIADNKIALNAGWDRAVLGVELPELAKLLVECNLDLEITGFEPAEVDALLTELVDPEHDPADDTPAPAKAAVSQRGDLWLLGRHRLLCGDSCEPSDVETLMGGELAAMVFADPPYNLRIASVQGRGKIRHREFARASGEMTSTEFIDFLSKWMARACRFSEDGAIYYVCMDWRHLFDALSASRNTYGELKNVVVWNKTNAGQGSFYRSQHELILVLKNGNQPHQNNVELGKHGRSRSNVWTYAGVNTFRTGRMDDLSAHPTVKPIALVADAMRDCSKRGDIILDPFIGSGTTILAAERVGRRAFGLEIDPLYVDVAIRRWQQLTGKDAVLGTSGQTFDEVATGHQRARRAR